MALTDKKMATIKADEVIADAVENGRVDWLKAKAAEIEAKETNNMKAFFALRKAYLAEFYPTMLEKKKAPKKIKGLFDKIREL